MNDIRFKNRHGSRTFNNVQQLSHTFKFKNGEALLLSLFGTPFPKTLKILENGYCRAIFVAWTLPGQKTVTNVTHLVTTSLAFSAKVVTRCITFVTVF